VQLSERLAQLAPTGLGHCFYASDGASAVEIALKMSAHYWRNSGLPNKTNFISLQNSYHGETLGALSVTDVTLFKDAYGALLKHHATVPSPDSRLAEAGESSYNYALRCAVQLEDYLQLHHQNIAAFIIEPLVQGAAGMAMYHPVYLARARVLCDQFNVHLIADEIAVGMGRTGTMFACEQASADIGKMNGITPDLLCLSKGITGGYLPLSVVMTRDQIFQAFYANDIARGFLHSHSYTGNPLACRAALATLDIFEQDNVLAENKNKAAYFNRIAQPLRAHPHVKHFRNIGMIWAFEVEQTLPNFAQRCFAMALEQQLMLRPIGNTLYFIPPYIISEAEINELITRTLIVIDRLIN